MQKKWIFLGGILVCLLVGSWALYQYHKPRTGTVQTKAAYTLDAETLYKEFSANEAAANERYNGKIIQVQGIVSQVIENANGVLIVLRAGDEMGGVSCSFTNDIEKKTWPQSGVQVTIKGRCSGFLMDVNLVDAVLIR